MGLRTRTHGFKETVTDFHTLDGLNAHHGACQSRIKTAIRLDIGTDARRNAVRHDLNHTAQRVGVLFRLIDAGDHLLFRFLVKRTHRRGIQCFKVLRLRKRGLLRIGNARAADGEHM